MSQNNTNHGPVKASSPTDQTEFGEEIIPENIRPKVAIFVLNRNGLEEDKLRTVLQVLISSEYAAEDVYVEWVSIFGALPERPHAFVTLSDDSIAEELIESEVCEFSMNDTSYKFEFSRTEGCPPNQFEDPNTVFITGIDVDIDPDVIEKELLEICYQIAEPKEIIFPRNWVETGNVIVSFYNEDCASMFVRLAKLFFLNEKMVKTTYARKRPEIRKTPPNPKNEKQHKIVRSNSPSPETEKMNGKGRGKNAFTKVVHGKRKNSKK